MRNIISMAAMLVVGSVMGTALTAYAKRDDTGPRNFNTFYHGGGALYTATAVSVATNSDGKIVYVGDLTGVWKSEDGGVTFTELSRPGKAVDF